MDEGKELAEENDRMGQDGRTGNTCGRQFDGKRGNPGDLSLLKKLLFCLVRRFVIIYLFIMNFIF